MRIPAPDQDRLLDAAMDQIPCDLCVTHVRYVNVLTGEIYPASVYVLDGFVLFVDKDDAQPARHAPLQTVDGEGRYLIPGLIDSHVHIESSMLTPRHFAEVVLPRGVTSIIHDPHELANVYGEEGVRYMHDAAVDLPQRQFCDIPSCVPPVPGLESSGATIDADSVYRLAELPNVIGLGEVMDYVGVIGHSERMKSMIQAARDCGLYIQGHLPVGDPRQTAAYLIGGPRTCHESSEPGDALTKLRAGMVVDSRESSMAKNLSTIWNDIKDLPLRARVTLCTDDREVGDLLEHGQLDAVLRKAIELGVDPVEAIRAATLHPAQAANLENLGTVSPGCAADFLLVSDLESFSVHQVYTRGRLVAEDGRLTESIPQRTWPIETRNSMNLQKLSLEDFMLWAPDSPEEEVFVNVMTYENEMSLLTSLTQERLPVQDGVVDIEDRPDLCYVAVFNRYGTGEVSLGLVRNFGLLEGADASTVSHDCHNLCIVYRDPAAALACAIALKKTGGGMAAGQDGELIELLPLPLGGLMSLEPAVQTAAAVGNMKAALRRLGLKQENPLLRIATLALIVIPDVKFSDKGLVDVKRQELVPILAKKDLYAARE